MENIKPKKNILEKIIKLSKIIFVVSIIPIVIFYAFSWEWAGDYPDSLSFIFDNIYFFILLSALSLLSIVIFSIANFLYKNLNKIK